MQGKLAGVTMGGDYDQEYGTDRVEVHDDAIVPGENVLVVDDLLATGGTAEAAVKLIRQTGGTVVGCCFIVDLPDLGGMKRLLAMDLNVMALCAFEGE